MDKDSRTNLTFWEHLDELRSCIIRILVVTFGFGILAFLFKDEVFRFVFAPKSSDFITYTLLDNVVESLLSNFGDGLAWLREEVVEDSVDIQLINTGLASQFAVHVKMAFYVGVLCASPYIIYVLFRFVAPGLYAKERKYAVRLVSSGYIMFILGMALSYFVIFPLTFKFLGTYRVSEDVENLISLDSYIDTFIILGFMLGIMFQLPVLCWVLSRLGVISSSVMRRYRKHAIVLILLLSSIVTPTSDVLTLLLVSVPVYFLYELGSLISRP